MLDRYAVCEKKPEVLEYVVERGEITCIYGLIGTYIVCCGRIIEQLNFVAT